MDKMQTFVLLCRDRLLQLHADIYFTVWFDLFAIRHKAQIKEMNTRNLQGFSGAYRKHCQRLVLQIFSLFLCQRRHSRFQCRTFRQNALLPGGCHLEGVVFTGDRSRHFQKIMAKTGMDEEDMKAAMARIVKLNPSPGGQVDDSYNDQAQQIVPDFLLDYEDGELRLSMPRFSIPEIRVNRKYADLLLEAANSSERQKKEAATFVKQKMDSAKWFVEALKQRHNTLQNTMQAIIDYQHDYFVDGDESHLRPMVLKDIAEKTGFDISTISRVVNSKYIETHFGIFPLKYFFSEGLENQEGEEVSTRELKKVMQECVDNEDKHKPLTDDQLVSEMEKRGYKVARRTIAKYRDQLGIPKARLRKEL